MSHHINNPLMNILKISGSKNLIQIQFKWWWFPWFHLIQLQIHQGSLQLPAYSRQNWSMSTLHPSFWQIYHYKKQVSSLQRQCLKKVCNCKQTILQPSISADWIVGAIMDSIIPKCFVAKARQNLKKKRSGALHPYGSYNQGYDIVNWTSLV